MALDLRIRIPPDDSEKRRLQRLHDRRTMHRARNVAEASIFFSLGCGAIWYAAPSPYILNLAFMFVAIAGIFGRITYNYYLANEAYYGGYSPV
jgi:hypothetical protein